MDVGELGLKVDAWWMNASVAFSIEEGNLKEAKEGSETVWRSWGVAYLRDGLERWFGWGKGDG